MDEERLHARIWASLLQALDTCQTTIDLLEQADAGTDNYLAEWEELDKAFDHMHNAKRWIGRSWKMSEQQANGNTSPSSLDTALLNTEEIGNMLADARKSTL